MAKGLLCVLAPGLILIALIWWVAEDLDPDVAQSSPLAGEKPLAPALLFFYDRGCTDCELIKGEFLPRLLEREGLGPADVRYLDVGEECVVKELFALERRLGFHARVMAPVLVLGNQALVGIKAVRQSLE